MRGGSSNRGPGYTRKALLVVLVSIGAWFATSADLRRLFCTAGDRPTRAFEYRFGAPVAGAPMVLVMNGCTENADGVVVPPNATCRIDIWLTRDRGERGRIMLKTLRPDGVGEVLTMRRSDNSAPEVLARDVYLTDEIDLPIRRQQSLSVPEMTFEATNPTARPVRVLYKADYSTYADAAQCLADFRRLSAAWGAVVFCALALWLLGLSKTGQWPILAAAFVFVAFSPFVVTDLGFLLVNGFALAVLYFGTRGLDDDEVRASILTTAALCSIGSLFIQLRYPYLAAAANARLDPDAFMYRLYADRMSLFSPTGFFSGRFSEREPLFIFVTHAVFRMFGSSELHVRYASFLSAIPLPFLTYWIARRSRGRRIAALIAALLVAFAIPYVRELPSRGLRDDVFMTLSAAFILTIIASLQSASNWRWIPIAAAGMACMWTRTPALTFALLFFVWLLIERLLQSKRPAAAPWTRPLRIWEAALCLLLIYASFLPIRSAWKRIYGQSDYAERSYARLLANTEFRDRLGTPGFATPEEFQVTAYSGPPITFREYLFGLHTPSEIVVRSIRGTGKGILDLLPEVPLIGRWPNRVIDGVFVLLLIGSLLFPPARILTMAALASLSYAGFFWDLGLIEFRSVAHALIPFSAAALVTADLAVRRLDRRADSGSGSVRDLLTRLRHAAAPGTSSLRMIVIVCALAIVSAAAVAFRSPELPASPSGLCLLLRGFYWKAAAVVSSHVVYAIPIVAVVAFAVGAIVAGIRWWAAIAVAAVGSLMGLVVTPDFLSGVTPRTYLVHRGDVAERSIDIPRAMRNRPARLRFYVREPFRTAPSPFRYVIEINGEPAGGSVSTGGCADCIAWQWRELPIPPRFLAGDRLNVRFRAVTEGDESTNYVDIGRVPFWRMGTSRWNGNEGDLSPDPGENHGTFLIGLSPGVNQPDSAISLWLGR